MSTIRIISMLTGLCLLAFVGSVSAANAPHYGSLVVCSSCHTTHNAAGPSLTTVAGNANLCMSCHFSGGIAGEKPFLTSMQPSGDFKTSHSWSGVMPNSANDQGANNPYGLRTDDQVADTKLKAQLVKYGNCSNGVDGSKKACESVGSCSKSTYLTQATCTANGTCIPTTYKTQAACSTGGGVWTPYTWTPHTPGTWTAAVVCSTCHAVMAQANAPWDPFATPSVSGVATGGSKTTVIDNSKTWTENQWEGYYVRVPNTVSGSIQVIGSNTANTLNLTTGAAFGTAVASGSTYGIQAAGKHFMRAKNDLSQMCEDCHYYRSATQISDVKTYNGSKKSHPVVKNISSDPADPSLFVGVAPYEPECKGAACAQTGAPRYHLNSGTDTNSTNNIVFDSSGKMRCLSCHGMHYTDSGDGKLLRRSPGDICEGCHRTSNNTPSPGETGYDQTNWDNALKTHSAEIAGSCFDDTYKTKTACETNAGVWTPEKWGPGGWGVNGGQYGEFTCATCHTSHDTTNIYLIKPIITAPSGNLPGDAVDFRNLSGVSNAMGDDSENHTSSTRICEVCHTVTSYHRYNTTAQSNKNHNNAANCTTCHSHKDGFMPFGGACNTCHGASGDTGAPLITGDLVQPPDATGSVTAGKHQKHVVDKDYPCNYCHTGYSMPDSTNHRIDIGFYLFGGAYQGGTYNGQSTATYNSSEQNTTVSNSGSKTCSNVYCHGKLPDGTIWGGGKNTSPQWDGSVTCTSCHDTGGSLSDLSGKHRKHTNESTYAYTCEKCHYETASGSSSIKNETYHVNNTKDLIFSKGGSFDSGTKSCTSTYCHSNARGGAPNVQPQWTSANAMQCDSCHNGRTGIETLEMRSNGHDRLVSSDWVRHYPCYYCHDATVNTSNGIKDYSKHVDENKDVVINSNWYISGNPVPSYNSNTKVCSNIYCHSDGTTVNPEVRPFAWTDGRTKCNTCHGHPTGTCGTCHNDGRTGWSAGQEWKSAMPMYTNTGPGTERANTHARHMLTDFTCDNCHDNTITNQSCNTTGCHTGSGTMDEINHINPAYHVNKTKDVAFKNGGTYNQVTKTCSNTACHTGADPQWGDSVNNTVICLSCHGTSNTDVDDFAKFNGTRAKINLTEWETTGHGRPTSAGNYPSGNPPANFPGNPCWYCHDNNILHNDSSNPFRLKQHQQFNSRFEKECVYCHMQGLDSECMNCHNASNSLAPQLTAITNPPFSQDHSGYTNGLTSCVTSCHATDAQRHNTGAGLWTAGQKVDIRNQYLMMGVCLQCHDDDSNGKCNQCHTGEQYKLGYDPGTGFIKANVSKATSVHFGYKHYAAYQNNGVWKGGKFCWDCHDPHGDSNIYMIQNKVATETDGTYGIPATRRDVSFTRKQSGLDYAKTSAPYNGICNVCHTETGQHYRFDYGDGHNAGRICTTCHEHRFSDSHASGKECNTCHLNKPIPRHTGFGLPRDCTKCHNGTINSRMDIMGQFRANSHHVQADKVTNKHCYSCHWEATVVGLINTDYHSGYNYKTHTSVKNAAVDLVIWGPGTRPEEYNAGTTAVTFTANKIGTADERTEVSKATQHCLGCHSDQNRETQPFNIADPDNGDCKTPAQYAWDRTSIGARYSQTGTATWGKYTSITNAAKKDISKAFSAHGNATANAGGWDAATGLDGTITNTRNGGQNIQCFDCHSSHGSKAAGVTSSYKTFNGTYNGANLKETQAGKGGYGMTYKAAANTTGVNPYNAGAGQCFDCHETATSGTKPWGYNSTYGATAAIMGYKDTSRFGQGTKGSTARYSYRASKATIVGGHFKASSSLKGLDGTPGTDDEAMGTINGLCTPCHDPHGVSPTLGDNQQYALPLLKGTWLTSPYKEDATPMDKDGYSGKSGFYNYRNYWDGSYVRPYPQKANPQPNNAWKTDRNTFNTVDLSNKANVPDSTYGRINEDDTKFAGLCLMCHPKNRLTDGTNKNSAFKTMDRIHETVKGWGTNGEHTYPCSKCHQPHNSGLPRLMQTNCLDYKHRGRVASGGLPYAYDAPSTWYYLNQYGRFPYGWWDDGFGTYSTAICHGAATANGSANWPDNQKWNSVTEW